MGQITLMGRDCVLLCAICCVPLDDKRTASGAATSLCRRSQYVRGSRPEKRRGSISSHLHPPATRAFLSDSAGGRGRVDRRARSPAASAVYRMWNGGPPSDGCNMEEGPTAERLLFGLQRKPKLWHAGLRCVRQNA
jgi:hypothetical protein